MATQKQIAANRRNAKKSTGPRSVAGKEKVSQNHLVHGLCGKFQVLANEDQAEYNDLFERFMQAEQPADDIERELVAKMARYTWMSERSIRCQSACYLIQPQTPEQKAADKSGVAVRSDLDVYLRYMTTYDRAYQRAADALAKRRKERLQREIGFERQKRAEAEEQRKAELQPYKVATAIARLALLEARLNRTQSSNRAAHAVSGPANSSVSAPKLLQTDPAAA